MRHLPGAKWWQFRMLTAGGASADYETCSLTSLDAKHYFLVWGQNSLNGHKLWGRLLLNFSSERLALGLLGL